MKLSHSSRSSFQGPEKTGQSKTAASLGCSQALLANQHSSQESFSPLSTEYKSPEVPWRKAAL